MSILRGNAVQDGADYRGWLIGGFIPSESLRHTTKLEVKWATHMVGEERQGWVTNETRTTVCLLVSGSFTLFFEEREEQLTMPGDYALWGPDEPHSYRADTEATTITIRWHE